MRFIGVFLIILFAGCSDNNSSSTSTMLFTDITDGSGINFLNNLTFTERLNPYTYRNFYNGAGVAIGDLNNDGLLDIYFAGNQVDNKLFVNQSNLTFKDVTESAGVSCHGSWSTGVTLVDINADGFLDIYVCKSGDPESPNRNNQLFINNGDLTFTEQSKEYGLDITGLSVQAAFFDYDKDGDLDCYLLTNSIRSVGSYDLIKDQRNIPDPQGGGNKFFINEDGKFIDASGKVRIYRSNIGFGLGITLGDFNEDSWTDIFVSNDFFERDYLYINDQKGAFTESLTEYFPSTSMGSMGADFADLDNDGDCELFVTEMLPDSLNRKKTKTVYESWDKYQLNVEKGYHHQFSRNVLQTKNNRSGTYSEIGRFAGVAASEWSWGALLFDMDNDGLRDIFIANGIYKDLLDRDYLAFTATEGNVKRIIDEEENAILKLIDLMPSSYFPNYAFKNEGGLKFRNMAVDWGLGNPMFSSGSAYGDLDNDGDLDLVVNNLNSPSIVFRNNSDSTRSRFVTISLTSNHSNSFAIGSGVVAYSGNKSFTGDNFITRGFQSAVQPSITLGLGADVKRIDSLVVNWPEGGYSILYDVPVNRKIVIKKEDVKIRDGHHGRKRDNVGFRMELVSKSLYKHSGSGLIDFNRDRLLPMMYSNETPGLVKGDVDGDGLPEVYVGGGKGQAGSFLKFKGGTVGKFTPKEFEKYALSEETKGTLFDIDKDGDLDIYLAMGGRFFPKTSSALADKIFVNDGKGNFSESAGLSAPSFVSTSVVRPIDFDNDGDSDILLGERFDPFIYGVGGRAYLLENDGEGNFNEVTKDHAPYLLNAGMVTDCEIADVDHDGWMDVIIAGDWTPIVILRNEKTKFTPVSAPWLSDTEGWWRDIETADLNQDGKPDFVLGNHGLNSFFKPGDRMYVNDFDGNGTIEQIFCTSIEGKYYPILDRDELISQLPSLKKTLLYYKDYGKKSINEIFPNETLSSSKVFDVKLLSSIVLLSDKNGYQKVELPLEAQYSPLYALLVSDFDGDGIEDLIAGGNQFQVKPQFGRNDASNGWFFKGIFTNGAFSFQQGQDLNVKGQIRSIEEIEVGGTRYIIFAKNDDDLEIYKISN